MVSLPFSTQIMNSIWLLSSVHWMKTYKLKICSTSIFRQRDSGKQLICINNLKENYSKVRTVISTKWIVVC